MDLPLQRPPARGALVARPGFEDCRPLWECVGVVVCHGRALQLPTNPPLDTGLVVGFVRDCLPVILVNLRIGDLDRVGINANSNERDDADNRIDDVERWRPPPLEAASSRETDPRGTRT